MRNVTIALDEATLREARRIAAERSTSLNALIRDFLERLTLRESRARGARRRIAELCRDSNAEVGERWLDPGTISMSVEVRAVNPFLEA